MNNEIALIVDQAAVACAQTASPYNLFSHPAFQQLLRVICEFATRTSPEARDTN